MPRTKQGVQFYVVLRTKVGCSFMSCPGRRSDAVLGHAQDENKFKTPSISWHEPGVLWFYLGTLHLVRLRGNYTKKYWRKVLNFKFLRRFVNFLLQIWRLIKFLLYFCCFLSSFLQSRRGHQCRK